MGYIRHNAIVITGDSYPRAQEKFESTYKKAKELFSNLVSEVIPATINGYQSFFIAPDGSKERWESSDAFDERRKELMDFIDTLAYDDGSNTVHYVDIGYDEYQKVKIDRNNQDARKSGNNEEYYKTLFKNAKEKAIQQTAMTYIEDIMMDDYKTEKEKFDEIKKLMSATNNP